MPKLSLERLIQSLSQGELRAFSLSIKKDNNPSYYTLFNDIRTGKSDDHHKKDNNEIQRRNYLYNSILESLVKSSKTIDSQISKGLHHVEILYNRQLEKEAWKELERVEKLANKHERFGYIIQVLEWKKILGTRLNSFTKEDYALTSKLEKETMENYKTYLDASNSYHELIQEKQTGGYVHDLDISTHEDLEKSEQDVNFPKRTLYYQRMAKAIHLCLTQDVIAQYKLTKLIIEDVAVINEANECLQAYFEHLTSCICLGEFDELITLLKKLKLDIGKGKFGTDPNIKIKLFYYAANYETMAYAYLGDSIQLNLKIKEVELGLKKLSAHLTTEMKLTLYSALKMGHYFLGNIEDSKKYLSLILDSESINIRRDIYQDALLFTLLINTDENKVDEMEQTLKQINIHSDLNKSHYQFEKRLVDNFKRFVSDKWNKAQLFDQNITDFHQNSFTLPNGKQYSENNYPYFIWAQARKQNIEIMEFCKSENKKL